MHPKCVMSPFVSVFAVFKSKPVLSSPINVKSDVIVSRIWIVHNSQTASGNRTFKVFTVVCFASATKLPTSVSIILLNVNSNEHSF